MTLSVESVLEIAQKMERNAANFYRKAASLFSPYAEELLEIMRAEEAHGEIFLKMQNSLDDSLLSQLSPDPFHELDSYLEAFADTSGGEGRPGEIDRLTGSEGINEILRRAVELEKESIAFYRHIEKLVPREGRFFIDTIVREEEKHIAAFEQMMGKNDL